MKTTSTHRQRRWKLLTSLFCLVTSILFMVSMARDYLHQKDLAPQRHAQAQRDQDAYRAKHWCQQSVTIVLKNTDGTVRTASQQEQRVPCDHVRVQESKPWPAWVKVVLITVAVILAMLTGYVGPLVF